MKQLLRWAMAINVVLVFVAGVRGMPGHAAVAAMSFVALGIGLVGRVMQEGRGV